MKWSEVKLLSRVRLFATPWTIAYHAPPSMGLSRQECWSGLPFPSPMSLLFNTLSRFVIAFLPRSKRLNVMAAVTMHSDFWAQENKICYCFHFFPIYLLWSNETRCHGLSFWMLNFMPAFSLSSFTFIKRLFSSSLLSAVRVVSFAYLR